MPSYKTKATKQIPRRDMTRPDALQFRVLTCSSATAGQTVVKLSASCRRYRSTPQNTCPTDFLGAQIRNLLPFSHRPLSAVTSIVVLENCAGVAPRLWMPSCVASCIDILCRLVLSQAARNPISPPHVMRLSNYFHGYDQFHHDYTSPPFLIGNFSLRLNRT
jgi:hypothetical protein